MINLHKKSRLTPLWALSLLSLLWGCASSPPPRYYNLLSTLPAPATQEADARPLAVIDIVNLHLPSALDQDRLLITQADQTITRLPQDRWAGPLEDEVRQVLQRGLWESAQAIARERVT